MYEYVLAVHDILRWAILVTGLATVVAFLHAGYTHRTYDHNYVRLGRFYLSLLHTELLLGLLLYFWLSPITSERLSLLTESGWLKDAHVRFKMLEHPLTMVMAVIISQVGSSRGKCMVQAGKRFKAEAIYYAIGLMFILSAIPWGGV